MDQEDARLVNLSKTAIQAVVDVYSVQPAELQTGYMLLVARDPDDECTCVIQLTVMEGNVPDHVITRITGGKAVFKKFDTEDQRPGHLKLVPKDPI